MVLNMVATIMIVYKQQYYMFSIYFAKCSFFYKRPEPSSEREKEPKTALFYTIIIIIIIFLF